MHKKKKKKKKFCDAKETFLSNSVNKAKMIELICTTLENCNISVIYSEEDADIDIAAKEHGVLESLTKNITVIGEDTDLLMLMLHHYGREENSK